MCPVLSSALQCSLSLCPLTRLAHMSLYLSLLSPSRQGPTPLTPLIGLMFGQVRTNPISKQPPVPKRGICQHWHGTCQLSVFSLLPLLSPSHRLLHPAAAQTQHTAVKNQQPLQDGGPACKLANTLSHWLTLSLTLSITRQPEQGAHASNRPTAGACLRTAPWQLITEADLRLN